MRALFIIHCQDPIYGASRSVGNLIRNLDADVDIIFPLKIKKEGRITQDQIKKYYGDRIKKVWYLPQPARLSIMPFRFSMQHHIKSAVKDVLYLLAKPKYRKIYRQGNYDFIHLNSITLYPMLDKKWPMFLHVRELARRMGKLANAAFAKRIEQAHGIIYIDPSTQAACPKCRIPQIVLVNPFDQIQVGLVPPEKARERFALTHSETVYAIIGNIIPAKGVDFVIRAFKKADLQHAVLLIVGRDTNHDGYEEQAMVLADGDRRIRFTGEVEEIEWVYRVTDYVVRGDPNIGLGRTVFEGLYSGCGVILPCDERQDMPIPDITAEMRKRIKLYLVQNEESLVRVFRDTQNQRFGQRSYESNVESYVKRFQEFISTNM